jgi:hypothetical protein
MLYVSKEHLGLILELFSTYVSNATGEYLFSLCSAAQQAFAADRYKLDFSARGSL